VCLIPFLFSKYLQELPHVIIESLLELLDHLCVVILPERILKHLTLLIYPLLSPLHSHLINPAFPVFLLLPAIITHVLCMLIVVLILCDCPLVHLEGGHLVEEALDDAREEVVVLVESCQDAEQVVVGQQALLQTLVQEAVVRPHHIVDCLHVATVQESLFKLQEVRLKDFYCHVVYVVFAKMKHSMPKCECMLLNSKNLKFFR
jgi:hypothetical protein